MGKNVNIDFEKEYNKAHEDGSSKAWEHFYKITENVPNRDFLVEQERNKKEEMAKQKRKAHEQKKRDEANKQEIINERMKYSAAFPLQELENMNAKIIKAGEEARATHLKKSNATDTELITERDKILSPINKYTEELIVVRDMMKNILNASNMFPETRRDLGKGYSNLNKALNNAKKKGTGLNPDAIQGLYDNASYFMTNLKLILSNKTNEIMFEPNKKSTIKDEEQYKKEIDNVLNLLPSRDITEEIKKMWETLDVFNQDSANKKKESEQVRQSAELEKAKELNEKILNSMIQAIDSLKKIKNIDIKDEKIEEIGDLANSGDYKKALSLAQDIKKMAMAAIDEQKKTESKQETAKPKSDKKQTKQEQKPKSNKKQTKKKDQHSENFYSDLKKERDEATAKLIECYKEIRRLEQEYCSSNMTDEEYDEETDKVLLEINKLEKMISNKTAFMYEELDNAVTKLKESQSKLANSKTDKSKKKYSEDIETAKKEIEDVFNNKLSKILNSDELNFLKTITSAYVKPDVKKVDVDNYNYNTVGGQYQAVISNYSQGAHANYVSALQLELDYIKQLQITDKLTNFSIEKLKSDVKKIKKLTKKKYSTTDLDERNKISVQIREARGELKKRLERLSKLAPEIKDLVNYVIHEHTKTYNENINPENLKDYQAAIKKAEDEYNTVISYLDGSDLTISEDLKERARLWSEQPKEEQEPDYSNLPTKTNRKVEYESAKKKRESELSSERYISADKISQNNPQAIIKNFEKNNKGWISGGETDTTATDLSSMINTLRGAKSADIEDVKTQITKKISEIRESIKAGDYEYKKYDTMERNGIIGQFETNMNPIELERFKEQVLENLQQYQDYVNDYSENVQRNEKIQEVLEANPLDKVYFNIVKEKDNNPIGKMVSYIVNEVEALYNDKDNRLSDNPKNKKQIFDEWQEKMKFNQSRFYDSLDFADQSAITTELYKAFGYVLPTDDTMYSIDDEKTYIDPKNQNTVAYKFRPSKNQNTKYTSIAKKFGVPTDGGDREYKIFDTPLLTTPATFQSRMRRLKDSDLEIIAEDFVNTLKSMENEDIDVKLNNYKGKKTSLAYFGIKSKELEGLDEDIDTRKKGYYTAGDLGRIYKEGDIYVQKRIEQVIKKIIKKYKLYNENPSSNRIIDEKSMRNLGDIGEYDNIGKFLDEKKERPENVEDVESMFYDMFLSTLRNNIEYINPDVSDDMMLSLGKLNGRLSTKGEMVKLEYEAGDANANKSGDDITPDLIESEIWENLNDEKFKDYMRERDDSLSRILNASIKKGKNFTDEIDSIVPRTKDLTADENLSIKGKSQKMYDLMYSLNRTMSAGTYAKESMKKYFKDDNLFGEDGRNYDFLQFFGENGKRIKKIFTISDRYQDFLKKGRKKDPYAEEFLTGLLKDKNLHLNIREMYTLARKLQDAQRMSKMAANLSKHKTEDGGNYRTVVNNMLDTLLMNENEEHTEVSERTGKEYTSLPNAEVSQMAKDGIKLVSAYKDYMINPLNTTAMYGDISYWRDSDILTLWNDQRFDRKKIIEGEIPIRMQKYIEAVQAYNEGYQNKQQRILYNPDGINYGEIDISNRIQQYSKLYPDLISKINLANPTVVYGGDEKLHVAPDYLQNNNGVDIFNGLVQDGTINTSGMSLAQANVYKSLLEKKRQMHISSLIVQKLKNKHIIKNKMTMAKGQNLNAISKTKDMFIGNRIKKSVTNEAYTKNIEEALKKKKVSKAIYGDTVARFNKSGKIFDYKLSDDEKNIRKQLTDYVNKPRIRTEKYTDEDNRTKTSTYLKLANQDEMNMRELVDLYPKLTDEYKSELFESIQNAYESFNEKDKTTFFDSLSFLSRYMPDDLLMDFARMNGQDERLQDFFQPVLDYNSTFEGNDKPYTGIKLSRSGTYYGISGLAKQYAKMSENDRQSAINDLGIIYNNSQTPEDKQKFLHALSQNYAQSDVGTEMYDTFFDSIRGDSEADTFLSNFFKPEVDLNHQWDDINYQGVGVRLPGSNIFLGPTGLNARYKAKDITTDSLQEYLKDIAEVNVSKYRGKNHLSYKLQDVAASKDGMSMTNLRNQYSKADKKGRQAIENLVEKLTYILPNGYVPGEGSELNDLIYSSLKAIVYDKDAPDNIKYDKDNALSNLVEAKFKTPKDADYADSVSNENIGEKNEDILNIVREALSSITNDEDKEKFIKSFKGSELIRDALLSNKVGSYYPDLKAIDNGGIVTDIKEIAKDYVNHKLNGEDESLNDLLKTINEVQNSISDDTLKENFINEINSAIENINNQRGLSGSSKIANTLTDELKGFASNNKMVKQPNQQLLLPEAKKKRTKAPKEDIQLAPILLPESKIEDIKSESTTSLPTQADVIEETTKSDIIIAEELPKQIVVEETAFDDLNKVVSIQHVDSMKEAIDAEQKKIEKSQELVEQLYNEKQAFDHLNDSIREHAETPNVTMGKVSPIMPIANVSGTENNNIGGKPSSSSPIPITGMPTNYGFYQVNGQDLMVDYDAVLEQKGIRQITKDDVLNAEGLGSNYKKAEDAMTVSEYVSRISSYKNPQKTIEQQINEQIAAQIMEGKNEITTEKRDGARTTHKISSIAEYSELTEGHKMNGIMATLTSQVRGDLVHAALEYLQKNSDVKVENIGTDKGFRNEINKANKRYKRIYGKDADISELNWTKIVKEMYSMYHDEKNGGILQQLAEFPLAMNIGGQQIIGRLDSVLIDKIGGKVYPVDNKTTGGVHAEDQGNQLSIYDILLGANKETLKEKLPIEDDSQIDSLMAQMFGQIINTTANGDTYKLSFTREGDFAEFIAKNLNKAIADREIAKETAPFKVTLEDAIWAENEGYDMYENDTLKSVHKLLQNPQNIYDFDKLMEEINKNGEVLTKGSAIKDANNTTTQSYTAEVNGEILRAIVKFNDSGKKVIDRSFERDYKDPIKSLDSSIQEYSKLVKEMANATTPQYRKLLGERYGELTGSITDKIGVLSKNKNKEISDKAKYKSVEFAELQQTSKNEIIDNLFSNRDKLLKSRNAYQLEGNETELSRTNADLNKIDTVLKFLGEQFGMGEEITSRKKSSTKAINDQFREEQIEKINKLLEKRVELQAEVEQLNKKENKTAEEEYELKKKSEKLNENIIATEQAKFVLTDKQKNIIDTKIKEAESQATEISNRKQAELEDKKNKELQEEINKLFKERLSILEGITKLQTDINLTDEEKSKGIEEQGKKLSKIDKSLEDSKYTAKSDEIKQRQAEQDDEFKIDVGFIKKTQQDSDARAKAMREYLRLLKEVHGIQLDLNNLGKISKENNASTYVTNSQQRLNEIKNRLSEISIDREKGTILYNGKEYGMTDKERNSFFENVDVENENFENKKNIINDETEVNINDLLQSVYAERKNLLTKKKGFILKGTSHLSEFEKIDQIDTDTALERNNKKLELLGKLSQKTEEVTTKIDELNESFEKDLETEKFSKVNNLVEELEKKLFSIAKLVNDTSAEAESKKSSLIKEQEQLELDIVEQGTGLNEDHQKIIDENLKTIYSSTEQQKEDNLETEKLKQNKEIQKEINKLLDDRLKLITNISNIQTNTNLTDEEKKTQIEEIWEDIDEIDKKLGDSKYKSQSEYIEQNKRGQEFEGIENVSTTRQSQQDSDARAKAMREYLRLLKEVHEREIELQNLREKVNKGGFSQRDNFKEYSEKAREFEQRQAELGAFQADTRNGQINYNGQTYTMTDDERKRFAEKVDDENYKFQRLNAKNQQSKVGFFAKTMDEIKNQALYHLQSGFSYQITGVIRQAFSTAIEQIKVFDAAMVNLQVVTGKNRTEIKGMIKDYSNLASELGSTTQEVIASANEFLRMGYNVDATNELIKQSMILSKVGMIDAAQSSEYLTAAIKGYKLEVSDASKVIDMATSLDMKYAVSAGYIFEALSRTANSARLAKVSMEELQAMIAVTGEVTQRESSVIGEGFKTAFARYGNLKKNVAVGTDMSGLEGENSDELEKVNDIEAVLNKYGIRMRESDNKTWRSYSAILKDVGTQWSKYSDYEKNAISTAMYGTRQREIGLTTLENYNRVLSATEIATYSNGSAAQKFQAYLEGIEATTKNVTVAWEKFVQSIGGSTVFKFVNKSLITLIENLRTLILVGGSVALFGNLDKILIALGGMTNTVGTKINTIKDIGKMLGDGGFSKIGGNLKKKWNDVQAEVKEDSVAKQTLNSMKDTNSFVQKIYNLLVDKKTEEKQPTKIESETETDVENKEAAQNAQEAAQNAQEAAQNGEQQPQSNFKRNLGASIGTIGGAMGGSSILGLVDEKLGGNGQLGSTIGGVVGSLAGLLPTPAAIGIGVAGIVTSVGIGIYKHIREEQKKDNIEKAQKSQQDFISAIQQKDNLTKYEQLSKGVSNTGQNVSLSDEDYQEFLTMGNQLAEVFPQYIQSIDDSGNAFIGLNGKIGNCSEEIVAFINTLKKQAAEKAIGNNDAYKLTAGEENIAKAKKNEESIQRAEYSLRNFDKDEDISAAHYIGEENIKEFKKKVKAEGLEKSFKMYRNAFSITNTDDYEKVVAFAKKYMGQKVLDMQQQSGKANVLQNVLPDFMNAYLPTDITEEEKGKIYDLLKGVSPDKLTDNVFLTNWFKNYKSYGLESLNPIQNTDEFSTSYVDYKKTIDETIKELVLRNKDNLTFKQGLGLSDTDELTVDILKEKLGYNITDNIDSTMLDLFGSKSRPAIFASDFSKGITVNQARKINNLSESDIAQIKENAQNNQTDIESEIFKFLNDYANSTVDDYFKEVVAGVKKLNPNKNLTNEDIKKIVSEYQKVGDISGEFDKNTKSAMDNLISLSKTLNINLDTMLDNINLLNDVDKMGRTTTKMSDIESLYNQYKNIKNDMGQNGGMLSTEGYELFEKNSFGKIMDAAINGTLNSGTLNSIMKGSLNIIEKKFDAKILNDVLDSSDFYKKQKDQLSKPILMGLKGKDYTVGTDISTVNELISISAGFGKSHNLANGESAVAIGNITDDNYGSILSSMKEYFIQNGQAITTNAELYKTIVNTFGNTDSKNLIIADDSQTENIAKQILSQLANDIDSYKDILGPAAESIVKTIRTHMYDPANQQKISDAWAFYDYQQAEYDFNTQKSNYAKQKKRNPRQQAKLEKQAREIDKQERLNELEDFLQRRNLIIEQYNNKIENMDWAKSILSDFDFDGKMEYTYKGMEQNLSKINELKKQFQEVQALDVQSAEEAQKKAEALKNIGQQIKDSTNNFLELEKNLKQLAIDETNTAISDSFELINKQMDILNKAANNTDINKSLISSSAATSVIDLNLDTSKEKENEITERRNLAEALLQEQETYQNAYVESQGEYLDKLKQQNRENIAEQRADLAEQIEDLKQQQEEAERNYQNTYTQWINRKYQYMMQHPESGIQMTIDEYNRLAEVLGKTGAYVSGLVFDESANTYIAPYEKDVKTNKDNTPKPPKIPGLPGLPKIDGDNGTDTDNSTTNTAEDTVIDGISEIDSKKVANNDKVKAKVKDVVDTCMGMVQDQITATLSDENSNISIMSNLFSISEKDQTLLADKFKELAQLVSTTYVTELQNSLNAVTDHDKAVEGANKRREKDGVSDENGEQGQPNKNNLIVQQLVDSIDVDKLSEQILENLKLAMQKVKDEWENAVKTDEQYQLSAILLLSSEWSAESGETLLSNNMYNAITLALTTAIAQYVTFINGNRLPAPMLSEDWGASGLGQRMLAKIQEAYSLVYNYAANAEITAPSLNAESWSGLSEEIATTVSQAMSEGMGGADGFGGMGNAGFGVTGDTNFGGIQSAAQKWMGTKYKYGGVGKFGIDCSSFTQHVFADNGINLPRTAQAQFDFGKKNGTVVSYENLQPGDLMYFHTTSGKDIGHTAIYAGDGKIMHASSGAGKVVTTSISNYLKDGFRGAIRYYKGTDYHTGGMALVGDENLEGDEGDIINPSPETVILPNGQMYVVGKNGPEFMDLPRGTQVLTTDETNELLNNTPHYADGTNFGNMDITQIPKLSQDQIANLLGKYFSGGAISIADAAAIFNAQEKSGMSAIVSLAIAAQETDWTKKVGGKNNYWNFGRNSSGWDLHYFDNDTTTGSAFSHYNDLLLDQYYNNRGLKTLNQIGPTYCDANWSKQVSSIASKLFNNAGEGGASCQFNNCQIVQAEGPYGTDKLNKDTLNMDTANKIMEASKAWSDAVDKMVDALVKSDLGYWLRRNEYKRNSIMDWEKNIYNNSEKDFFDVVGFNAKRSIYLKEDIPTKNFGMIKSLEKTVQDLRVLFEKETDVAIKTAMGDQITNLLSKIDEFTEEINTAVNDMIASANQSAEQRQQKYEYDKGIADSRIGFGFVQKTGEYFRQNIENLKAVRAERESALSEIKRVLYDQYKKSGKYTEEQIESLIENNSAVREATNAINEVDNTIKSERIGAYDNAISVTERRNAMNESRYGTWADSDSKLTYRKEFLDENNNSIKLLERAALLRTKLMDPNSLLSVDEKEQAVTEYNNTIHEFWNGLSENLEKVQNINIQNSKNKDTAITDSASIGRIDTYNKKYSEDRLGLANNRVNEINQKIRNEQAILGYEAQQMGYAVGSKKYKEYIENSETMIRLKSEEVEANQEINSILEERLKISNEQIDNDQTLLDLRKEDEWNSISNIESYYERTENNLQKKRSELVHYMEIAKLSREDYEAKRMELAQLDKEIADTRLNALKEKQEYYKTAYNSMTYMVNEYTNALSDEKDNVSERYDKEIRKLEKVNDAKERSIKLTELQNNLENAKKGKKRVYRAGVGFVYEDDRESISKAEKDLDDFYRSDRISSLQKAQEMETRILDERIKAWNKYLKAVEKVYNTAERRDHMSNFNKMFGTEGWNGIWNLLDSDMGEYLTQADKGDKIYFGEMTDMLDKYIGGSSEIYQLVHSIKDILVDAPIFNKTDGLDVSQLRPDGIIPKLLTNINSIQSDEFIRLNKERAESYDWKNFTYKKDGKGEDIHISDYSEVLGDNGSNILESIAKTYGISVLEAKAIVTNLQEQKNKELKTNFTGTGKYANVDIMSIIQGGVIPKALLAEGYSLKDLKDARDIKIDQLMATTADADKKAEYQKMREQMIDGTNSPVTNLEELFKNNPTMSVSDVKDFVENNRVNMGNLLPSGEIKDFENFLFTNKKMFDFYGNMSSKDFVTLATMGGKDAEFIEKWAPVLENIFSAADVLEQNADKDSIQGVVLDTLNALGPDVLKEYMSKYGDTVIDNAKSNADYSNNVLTKDDYKEIYDKQNERINEVYSKYNLNPDEGYNGILNYMESNNLSEINGVSAEVIKSFLKDKVYTMFEKGELNQYDANGTLDTKATKAYMNKLLRIKNVGEPTTLEKNNVFSYIKDFVTLPFSTYKVTENGNGIDTVKKPKIESTIADVLGTLGANIIPNQTNYWVVKSGSDIVSLMNNVRGMNNITNG